ncbi:MAG: hypothetical protein CMI60_19610 [Parvibaculum sp.]|nr:hypothetical protein [Parvibaculum sp.]
MAKKFTISKEDAEVIRRCATDFTYFCENYLKIVDKDGELINLKANHAQKQFLEADALNPWQYVLKGRKLGLTTIIAAKNFWRSLFTPHYSSLVMAHTDDSAKAIFRIYKRFYRNLPPLLQFPIAQENLHEMSFEHGGRIVASTAGSEALRGDTFQAIHCSEFAMYSDIQSTIAAALNTAGENASVALETTAKGLNDAHKIWYGQNGFNKLFISWADSPECSLVSEPDFIPSELQELAKEHKLSTSSVYWGAYTYITRCASDWNTFCQEYPVTADLAFITSGRRFFTSHIFPHAKAYEGYEQYLKPSKYCLYTMGVDTASGSLEGDHSSFVVMDVTNKRTPMIASSFYGKIPPTEFARQVLIEAKKYKCLIVPESNSYGLSIIEYLVAKQWGLMYRRTKYDSIQKRWQESMGFQTNVSTRSVLLARMQEYISREWLKVTDERLKDEINTFVFSTANKPQAEIGRHDDMIFACALSLIGMEQVDHIKDDVRRDLRPNSVSQVLEYELATGQLYSGSENEFGRDSADDDVAPNTELYD